MSSSEIQFLDHIDQMKTFSRYRMLRIEKIYSFTTLTQISACLLKNDVLSVISRLRISNFSLYEKLEQHMDISLFFTSDGGGGKRYGEYGSVLANYSNRLVKLTKFIFLVITVNMS